MSHWLLTLQSAAVPLSECICPQHKHSRGAVCCFKLFSIIYRHRLLVLLWPKVPRGCLLAFLLPWPYICNTLDPLAPITSSSRGWTQRVRGQFGIDWMLYVSSGDGGVNTTTELFKSQRGQEGRAVIITGHHFLVWMSHQPNGLVLECPPRDW